MEFGFASSSFVSLHDGRFLSTLLANKDFLDGNNSVVFRKDYTVIQHNEKNKDGKYYRPNGWLRFKYYIPAGTSAHLVLAAIPNISMRIDLKYKGDKNNILDHIHPQPYRYVPGGAKNDPIYSDQEPTIKYTILNVFSQSAYDMDEGGWMYVCIVENDAEYAGEHGRVQSAHLRVDYSLKIIDKEKFNDWLYQTTFLHSGGDPVDAIEELVEYDNILENGNVVPITRDILLNTQGNYKYHLETSMSSQYFSSSSSEFSSKEDISNNFNISSQSSDVYQNNNETQNSSIATGTSFDKNITEEEKENIQMLLSKSFPITGYFVGVPSENPKKWFYIVRKSKEVYEFKASANDSSSDEKKFRWIKVKNIFPIIRGNQVKFVSDTQAEYIQSSTTSSYSYSESSQTSSLNQEILSQQINSSKSCISGYHYNSKVGYCQPD